MNLFKPVFALVSFNFARYTVLTSPVRTKQLFAVTALLLSLLVALVSRKVIYFLRTCSISLAVMLYFSLFIWPIRSLQ